MAEHRRIVADGDRLARYALEDEATGVDADSAGRGVEQLSIATALLLT